MKRPRLTPKFFTEGERIFMKISLFAALIAGAAGAMLAAFNL